VCVCVRVGAHVRMAARPHVLGRGHLLELHQHALFVEALGVVLVRAKFGRLALPLQLLHVRVLARERKHRLLRPVTDHHAEGEA
jgi:hypothetical protein